MTDILHIYLVRSPINKKGCFWLILTLYAVFERLCVVCRKSHTLIYFSYKVQKDLFNTRKKSFKLFLRKIKIFDDKNRFLKWHIKYFLTMFFQRSSLRRLSISVTEKFKSESFRIEKLMNKTLRAWRFPSSSIVDSVFIRENTGSVKTRILAYFTSICSFFQSNRVEIKGVV